MNRKQSSATVMRVLLVEDNHDISANVRESFEQSGHIFDCAYTAESALVFLSDTAFDLLIIDIMLPGKDGINLCRQIRESRLSTAPILMLTARDAIDDKLAAFDSGADDYLIKPFSTRELLARAVVLSRRKLLHEDATIVVGALTLNIKTQTVSREGQTIDVGKTGFRITRELMSASPAVVLRDDLEHALWGEDRPDSDALRTHISVLRKVLDKPFELPMIKTVHGAGWKIIDPEQDRMMSVKN